MTATPDNPRQVGRYQLSSEIAAGGMATVHLGRLVGPVGFARTVAIKRLHPHFARDPEFVSMFLDEARLAARIRHPNVVSTLDVVASESELYLVMDYVHGAPLSRLIEATRARRSPMPAPIAAAIIVQTLLGLHAAHDAKGDGGHLLEVVHRDLSPHNILVGEDGVARVADFGVAKAAARAQTTHKGQLKGKLSYMSPEQVMSRPVDRRTDVFTAGVVFWECLTNERLFAGDDAAAIMAAIIGWQSRQIAAEAIPPEALAVLSKSLAHDPEQRYSTAKEMARELAAAVSSADGLAVADWVKRTIPEELDRRAKTLAEFERTEGLLPSTPLAAAEPNVSLEPSGSGLRMALAQPLPPEAKTTAERPTPAGEIRRPVPRRWRGLAGLVVTGLALALALAVLYSRQRSAPTAGRTGRSAQSSSSQPDSDVEKPQAHPPTPNHQKRYPPETSADATAVIDGITAERDSGRTEPRSTRRSHERAGSAARRQRARPTKLRPECNPPYAIRPDGFKQYKPECL